MVQVFQSFTTKLSEVVDQTAIHTDQGKARLLKDVTYFTRRLSSLQGVVGPSREVLDAVEAIKVTASDPSWSLLFIYTSLLRNHTSLPTAV